MVFLNMDKISLSTLIFHKQIRPKLYSFGVSSSSFVLVSSIGLEKGVSLHVVGGFRSCNISSCAQIQVSW